MERKIYGKYVAVLEGVTQMLMHAYTVDGNNQNIGLTNVEREMQYHDEWRKTAYVDPEGYIAWPTLNIKAMLLNGAKGIKVKRSPAKRLLAAGVTTDPPYGYYPVFINGNKITLDTVEEKDWILRIGAVVNKNRVVRSRVCIPIGWQIKTVWNIVSPEVSPELLEKVLVEAGYKEGLSDWRPGAPKNPGDFGIFEVVEFKAVK